MVGVQIGDELQTAERRDDLSLEVLEEDAARRRRQPRWNATAGKAKRTRASGYRPPG